MGLLGDIVTLAAITASASAVYSWLKGVRNRRSRQLPPSPKRFPIIGHMWDLPPTEQWKVFHQWSRELGTDVLYVNLLGRDIVVLDTLEAATELMDKRSLIYSGRMRSYLFELFGWGWNGTFLDYGPRWRQQIRLINNAFQPSVVTQFHPHIQRSAHEFLHDLLLNPQADIMTSIGRMTGRTMMYAVYGTRSKSDADVCATTIMENLRLVASAVIQGAYVVDFLPFLRHVPAWMPGAGFQKAAAQSRKLVHKIVDQPFAETKQAIKDGVCPRCFCSDMLQERDDKAGVDDVSIEGLVRDSAGVLVGGASETTVAVIGSCILGLLQNPSNITRAQAELDKVIGPGQLPSFDHEPELPFITAIVYEALRWRDVAPMGIPHKLSQDDIYKGYHIPAGSMILANLWAMLHDENIYPDPFTFNPSRFMKGDVLDKDVRSPVPVCFGFGRRTCAGRHMALSAVWMAIASVLFCFDIQKARDENGDIIEPLDEILYGLACVPKSYKSCLTPRSDAISTLIQRAVGQDGTEEERGEHFASRE